MRGEGEVLRVKLGCRPGLRRRVAETPSTTLALTIRSSPEAEVPFRDRKI